VQIPGRDLPEWVTIDSADPSTAGWRLYVKNDGGTILRLDLSTAEAERVVVLTNDGGAESAHVLAGLWTQWMRAAGATADATIGSIGVLYRRAPGSRVRAGG